MRMKAAAQQKRYGKIRKAEATPDAWYFGDLFI